MVTYGFKFVFTKVNNIQSELTLYIKCKNKEEIPYRQKWSVP